MKFTYHTATGCSSRKFTKAAVIIALNIMIFNTFHNLVIIIFVVIGLRNEVTFGTICENLADQNNASYIKMCEDGNITFESVILDTHESESTGETTCTCSVTNEGAAHVLPVGDDVNPNTTDCGSKITVFNDHSNFTIECTKYPIVPLTVQSFSIIWERTGPGDSKYCLKMESIRHAITNLTVVCKAPSKMVIETSDSTSSTSYKYDTSTVSETTRSTSPSTSGIPYMSTYQDVSSSPANNTSDSLTTSSGISSTPTVSTASLEKCATDCCENCLPVYVLVLTNTVAYLIAIIATVGNFLYFRRYTGKMEKEAAESTTGTTNGVAGAGYEDLQLHNVSHNNYEEVTGSSGGNTYSELTQ